MSLTKEQQEAIALKNTSGIINASAGSGKTLVLIERILHLLKNENFRLEEILAITFTEKAAAELKERLSKKLTDPQQKQQVENSYISTIHSFCSRVLREHCFEAGLNPNFKILANTTEAAVLLEECAQAIINEKLHGDDTAIIDILNTYKTTDFIESAATLLGHLRGAGFDIEDLNELFITETYWQELPLKIDRLQELIFTDLQCSVSELSAFSFAGKMGLWLNDLLQVFHTYTPESFNLLDAQLKNKPRKSKEIDNEEEYELFKKSFDAFRKEVKKARELIDLDLEQEQKYTPLYNNVLQLIKEIYQKYQLLKEKESLLDFEDLQLRVKKLFINNTNIRNYYQTKFKQIMLDEFQDTDHLQKEIFDLISAENNLFIVGDWKQSIYRFRNADVHIFIDVINKFRKTGQKNIPLQENFRSAKPIIDFANFMAKQVWDNDRPEYDQLIYAANKTNKQFKEPSVTVNLISTETEEVLSKKDQQQIEATVIAREIQVLKQQGYGYNKMTILLKTFSALSTYENTLTKYNIPFITFGGKYYYQREEIVDLINFLKIIDNPLQEATLAGILRSPFVGIRDESLLILTSLRKENLKLINLLTPEHLNNTHILVQDKLKLLTFIKLYNFLTDNLGKLTINKLLTELIDQSGYRLLLLTQKNGEKKAANINKLIELARGLSAQKNISLCYFVKYLEKMQEKEAREEEAVALPPSEEIVKIMTVHKAKGLEFPIVFLPDINRQNNNQTKETLNFEFNIYQKHQFPCGLRYTETSGEKHKNHIYKIQEYFNKKEERLEAKRLFYVALTRAEEKLYLSSILKKENVSANTFNNSGNWGEWLSFIYHNKKAPLEKLATVNIINETPEKIFVNTNQTDKSFIHHLSDRHSFLLTKTTETLKYSRLSVTELLALQKDKESFLNKYYFEFPELPESREFKSKFSKERSEKIGNFVHKTIQNNHGDYQKLIDEADYLDQQEKEHASGCLNNYFNSSLYQELKQVSGKYFELSFDLLEQDLQIDGRIDLVYCQDNHWQIVDFKTNQQTPENLKEYQQQLSLYASALAKTLQLNTAEIKLKLYYLYENELVALDPIPDIINKTTEELL